MEVYSLNRSTQVYKDYPLHQHGYWEIIFSLQGEGEARIQNEIYPFKKGTVFCIPPWTPHCKKSVEGFVDGCLFVKDMTPPGGPDMLVFEDDADLSMQRMFLIAFETQLKGEANARQVIDAIGDAIYQMLVSIGMERGRRRNESVTQFQKILLQNITNCDFDITAQLRETGYSSSYFRKVFKETLGSSPVDYFTHLRIEHAKRQLRQYHDVQSIREIAESAGFSDPYYFSRKFRQYTGKSPSQYVAELGEFNMELLVEELTPDERDPEALHRRQLRNAMQAKSAGNS